MPSNPVTVTEAARLLGVPQSRMSRLVLKYGAPSATYGNVRLIDLDDARHLVEAHPSRQAKGEKPAPAVATFRQSA